MSHAFQVVQSAKIFPARCPCGSVQAPLIDTFYETHAGRIYLCSRCVGQAAGLLGWTSPEDTATADEIMDGLRVALAKTEGALVDAIANQRRFVDMDELLDAAKAEPDAA